MFDSNAVVIVGTGACAEEALRCVRDMPAVTLVVPIGLGLRQELPHAIAIDLERLDTEVEKLGPFRNRPAFLAGDVVGEAGRAIKIPNTVYHKPWLHAKDPTVRMFARAVEDACRDQRLRVASLHAVIDKRARLPLPQFAQAGGGTGTVMELAASDPALHAVLDARGDTVVAAQPLCGGALRGVRFYCPPHMYAFDTAFLDAGLISECVRLGYRHFEIGAGVLVLEPLLLDQLCRANQLVLVDRRIHP